MAIQPSQQLFPRNSFHARLTTVLCMVYLALLCWILLFKMGVQFSYMSNRRVNLVPFSTLQYATNRGNLLEILSNVVIFIPLGIYAGMLLRQRSAFLKILFFLLTSFSIELLQYVLKIGSFDITDLITNTTGGIIGLMIFYIAEMIIGNKTRTHRILNVLAALGTAMCLILLFMLKMNMLPVRYQ